MRMLGSVRLGSNKRITVPDGVIKGLKIDEDDFMLFYEDKGVIIIKGEKG